MKKLLLILLFLSVFLSVNCHAIDYTQDANCVMAFLMDVDEDPLTDSAGSFVGNLKADGEPDYSTTAPPETYTPGFYDFDGADDYVYMVAPTEYGNADMSVVFWSKQDSFQIYSRYMYQNDSFMIASGDDFADNEESIIAVFYNGGTEVEKNTTTYDVPTGTWIHVGVTYDDSEGTVVIYINGVSQDLSNDPGWNITNGTDNFVFLGVKTPAGLDAMDMKMCEYALFDDILSGAEVADIYNNGLEGAGEPPEEEPVKARPMILILE